MLNTRASIHKTVDALVLGLSLLLEDYGSIQPGAGPYPSLAVRILSDDRQRPAHFGRLTPRTPAGAHRETLVVECEVRTQSSTWNQALHYAGLLRAGMDERSIVRRTWLLDADTPNPNPAAAGSIRFGESQLTMVTAEGQPDCKSAFLTWECQVEVPIP